MPERAEPKPRSEAIVPVLMVNAIVLPTMLAFRSRGRHHCLDALVERAKR